MRIALPPVWFALAWLSLHAAVAVGQQVPFLPSADDLYSPRFGQIPAEEPRQLPVAVTVQAQPLPATAQSPAVPRAGSPPLPFRLTAAVDPAQTSPRQPLRLLPRSQGGSRQPLSRPTAPSVNTALGTVAGSLGIVLGLFLVVVWCSRRFAPLGTALLPKEAVELLGRAPLASKQQMQLVRIGNKLLLVALSPLGTATLTEVTDAAQVEHLTALCRRGQPGSSSAAFRQVLDQIASEPAAGGFVGAPRPQPRGAR